MNEVFEWKNAEGLYRCCLRQQDEIRRLNNIINEALYWLMKNTHYSNLKVDKLIQDDNTNLLELYKILNKGDNSDK